MNLNDSKIPSLSDLGVSRYEGRLSSGIRVILFEKPYAPISLRVVFLAGSRFDPLNKDGCAHFMEHMILAGTKMFPRKDLMALHIERFGGHMSAATGQDVLKVDLGVPEPSDVIEIIRLLNEILTGSLFSLETIETERGSILKEIGMSKASLGSVTNQLWHELIFQGTILSRLTLGKEETVKALSRNDLVDYYKKFVTAERATIIVAGGIKMNKLLEVLESGLNMPLSGKPFVMEKNSLPTFRKDKISIKNDSTSDQVYLGFGFRTVPIFHDDVPTLDLIAEVVGGGRSSILMQKLRYDKGLVYTASADSYNIFDSGEWFVHTSTSSKQVSELILDIISIISEIKRSGLPADLVQAKKMQAVKSLRVNFQTSHSWVSGHSYSEAIGLAGETAPDWIRKLIAVSEKDIIRVANRYFTDDNWYIAAAGKIEHKDLPEIRL